MAKKELKGGLQNLLQRNDQADREQDLNSTKEELIATIKDDDLKEALQNEEVLRSALRSKRFAGGRPRKGENRISKSEGYERISLIANIAKMNKIREIAFRETLTIKQIFEAMCDNLIQTYEAKHGEITPTDHSGDANKLYN